MNLNINYSPLYYVKLGKNLKELEDVLDLVNLLHKRHLWVQTVGSYSHTKSTHEAIGYKNHYLGIVIGGDKEFENGLRLGLSYNRGDSNIKTKVEDGQSQTQYNLNSHILTTYGEYRFDSGFFLKGYLKYGQVFIDKFSFNYNDDSRASGGNKAYIYGATLGVGYPIFFLPTIILTPFLGLSNDYVRNPSYKESWSWPGYNTHVNISSHIERRFIINPGIHLQSIIVKNDHIIVPEIYISINYIFSSQDNFPRRLKVENTEMLINAEKLKRTSYTVGGHIRLIKKKKCQFEMRYDYNFISKYRDTHTAWARIILNF
ncbi:autotransporter outer membrane beta-barrel domain-containing protein [Candidatus Finniella inopinata]|uniref:Autotransporter outer membrane beta-barrel domain-containing protein n=2 Tax=Candidatus Finniella inopinata TaxID=1696036 RepID=A0A4Q7DG72_9PROT|nr:autotransporter outer membrane beta-barrel domain-containing protein [Candidatus Finniella inopinata]